MPRPKSIPWKKRVDIFLSYRQTGGKVSPVAKIHAVARSTVTVVVNEFKEVGFSSQPRAKVSLDLLREMQERHIANLVELPGMGVGELNLGPGTANEADRREASANPLPVSKDSLWHLRGTETEQLIREARTAVSDYLQRESEAWQALRQTLEESCRLSEHDDGNGTVPNPHLLPELKHRLSYAFFDGSFLVDPPPQSWLQWDVDPSDANALRLNGSRVAIGSSADHQRLKNGLSAFLLNGFKKHQARFFEIDRLRRDMMLLQGVVSRALGATTEQEIRRGICPACPYPEASLEGKAYITSIDKEESA